MNEKENRTPLKYEVYYLFNENLTVHKCFTVGKEYPIYKEYVEDRVSPVVAPTMYVTEDDEGRTRHVPSNYFTPKVKLVGDDLPDGSLHVRALHEYEEKNHSLTSSGIPDAIWRYNEIMKEAADYLQLAGVDQSVPSPLLDELEKIERRLSTLKTAVVALKKNVSLMEGRNCSLDERKKDTGN